MKEIQASLFISTYNMPHHLELVCAGLLRQKNACFEVLFCDDGSGDDTKRIIEKFKAEFQHGKTNVRHFWQENKGFRKCRILNQALRQSRGRLSIFLDGDCVPHSLFIADHIRNHQNGYYSAGRRVEIGPRLSEKLTPEKVTNGALEKLGFSLIRSFLSQDSQYLNRCFRVENPKLRNLFQLNRVVDLKGCNYSVLKSDLEAINGFDESYEGYGREDTDVELRLQNLGLKIKSLKGFALQYHIWHPRRDFTPANEEKLEEVRKTRRVRCSLGLAQEEA